MKVHISARMDENLARFLEEYQERHELKSRSEALERAVAALRDRALEEEYARAMDEWTGQDRSTREAWERTSGDGVDLDEAW
jgi:Arc/MetJ-type ribon-helix-helix transcriptional regulator